MLRKPLLTSLLAACAIFTHSGCPVHAADLGGDCCADLEERIAELEATAVRKGNRKVSLTVSGWVTQQVMFWDDGQETNTYVHDLGSTLCSHFKFSGQANFAPGWSAGYVLHIEGISSDGLTHNQFVDNGPGALGGNVQVLNSYWFVKSETLGKVSLGHQSQASDNAAILADGSGSLVQANWVAFDTSNFFLRRTDGGLVGTRWGNAGGCHFMGGVWGDCNGLPRNVVRYDSPTFGGFSVSASWGEDDMWDVAGRYAGTWGDFKVSLAAAYNETNDPSMGAPTFADTIGGIKYFQAGAYAEHVPTGLFAYGAYGHLEVDVPRFAAFGAPGLSVPPAETFYVKGGLRQRWSSLGTTILYGEFLQNADGFLNDAEFPTGSAFGSIVTAQSTLDVWGLGIVQDIDAAAMSLWVKYRRMGFEAEAAIDGIDITGGIEFQDFQYIGAGAIIHF